LIAISLFVGASKMFQYSVRDLLGFAVEERAQLTRIFRKKSIADMLNC